MRRFLLSFSIVAAVISVMLCTFVPISVGAPRDVQAAGSETDPLHGSRNPDPSVPDVRGSVPATPHQWTAMSSGGMLPYSAAIAISNGGQIVGVRLPGLIVALNESAVLWENGHATDLGVRGDISLKINERGQIAIQAYASETDPGTAFIWDRGTLTEIGALQSTSSVAINDQGQVAVSNSDAGFIWKHGTLTDVGVGVIRDINNRGQAVGTICDNPPTCRAFLWEHGVLTDIDGLGGHGPHALAINARGEVPGIDYVDVGYDIIQHGFVWDRGVGRDLGGDWVYPRAINNQGQVIGAIGGFGFPPDAHGFVWDKGVMTDLGQGIIPTAINDRGQVIGVRIDQDLFQTQGFLWEGGVMTPLGDLGGSWSSPNDINERGQVVGASKIATGELHAFLWENGVMTDLHELLP
jgi:probable HAF family extracellular repeat protein